MLSGTCTALAHTFAHVRARVRRRAAHAAAARVASVWMGVRVRVPWPADGEEYAGTVVGVRGLWGTSLCVWLDVPAGKDRLRAHTIPVCELYAE